MTHLPHLLDRGWSRPGPTPVQVRHDVLLGLGAAVVFVGSAELWHSSFGTDMGAGGVEAYLLFALAGAVLAGRRLLPLSSLVAQSVLFFVIGERLAELALTFTVQMAMFASLYAAWAWSSRPRHLFATTAVVVAAMFGWLVQALLEEGALPTGSYGLLDADQAVFVYQLLVNVTYFGGAIAWGQAAYRSAWRSARIAEQQETERQLVAREQERALHDERLRIARDLHDVVAHHVSGIGVQAAGAGRVLDRDPVAARGALSTIESSSRQAVSQMHRLVGLLRDDDPQGRTPQPGVERLASLAEGPVEHRVVGTPFPLPATLSVSVYRVAQEAVTNVHRHSGARQASLVLRYLDDDGVRAVEVEVIDDGAGAVAVPSAQPASGGYGLQGIRERAGLHDGEVEVGPRPERGFRVRVRFPVEDPA